MKPTWEKVSRFLLQLEAGCAAKMQALFLQSADLTAAAGFTKVKADSPFWPDGLTLSLAESAASPWRSRRWKGRGREAGSPAPPAEVLSGSEPETGWEAKRVAGRALSG